MTNVKGEADGSPNSYEKLTLSPDTAATASDETLWIRHLAGSTTIENSPLPPVEIGDSVSNSRFGTDRLF
jgi:hypothetical protein